MASSNELLEFVRESLGRGMSRAQVEEVLLQAGWNRDLIETALRGYADVEFPIPVPKPRTYLSAREAFMYLLLFSTLYISAFNMGVLAFQWINRAVPDAAAAVDPASSRPVIRWALSSLVVSFPIFVWLSAIVERSVRRDPGKRRSNVRRWLMYLTVFVAAAVLIGDFITLVYNLLGGELTIRFMLKVLTIATIAGTIFGYYLSDLRLEDTTAPDEGAPWKRAVTRFAVASVGVVVVAALFMIGSPSEERARRLDARRIADLRRISGSADLYLGRQGRLPASLEDLSREGGSMVDGRDPDGRSYEYRVTGERSYELCATFQRDSSERLRAVAGDFWSHGTGRRCFQFQVKEGK
ncbi:MAG: DUF5671 domain-containing protein [Vicinamibacterales bacterium]